jgi:glycosyltransferase involved in cell wall biosynthesis
MNIMLIIADDTYEVKTMTLFRQKRLLILSSHYRNFIKDQVEELSKYFNEIHVIIRYNPLVEIFSFFNKSFKKYQKDNLVNYYKKPDNVFIYFSRITYLPTGFYYNYLGELFFKSVMNCIKKNNLSFDLIHAHFSTPMGYCGVRLSKLFNIPVVITLHENREWFLKEYHSDDRKIYWTWKNSDALIRVNKKDLPLLQKFNPNTYYIPNGFNPLKIKKLSKDEARECLSLSKEKKIIFSLGNLIERKGFKYLINSLSQTNSEINDLECYIGGRGPLFSKLNRLIDQLGLTNVKLLGFVDSDELNYWYNACDLFVFPSLSESFGITVLEALAVGTPVIATINGGSEEIVVSEKYGILVESGNSDALSKKIILAFEKKWNNLDIISYSKRFTWPIIVDEIINLYLEILDK